MWSCEIIVQRHGMVDHPGRKFDQYHHRVPRLRMSGAMYLLPLYAFMAWTGQHYAFVEKPMPA